MPKLTITGNPIVGGELDWEFSVNGLDVANVSWLVSNSLNKKFRPLELGNSAIQITPDFAYEYVKVRVSVLELDRNGTRILCEYTSLPVRIKSD
jgi:hypothetical protein